MSPCVRSGHCGDGWSGRCHTKVTVIMMTVGVVLSMMAARL